MTTPAPIIITVPSFDLPQPQKVATLSIRAGTWNIKTGIIVARAGAAGGVGTISIIENGTTSSVIVDEVNGAGATEQGPTLLGNLSLQPDLAPKAECAYSMSGTITAPADSTIDILCTVNDENNGAQLSASAFFNLIPVI